MPNAPAPEKNIVALIAGVSPLERRIRKASVEQVNSAPFYIVMSKRWVEEIDHDDNHYDKIVRDIAGCQYEQIDRVFHCTPGGICEDVTRDTALDVEKLLIAEEGSDYRQSPMAPWLERVLGGLQFGDAGSDAAAADHARNRLAVV